MTDSRNRIFPLAKPAVRDGSCSHHFLLLDGATVLNVLMIDGANDPHVADLDGAFSPEFMMFSRMQKHIPVSSKEGGSAQAMNI